MRAWVWNIDSTHDQYGKHRIDSCGIFIQLKIRWSVFKIAGRLGHKEPVVLWPLSFTTELNSSPYYVSYTVHRNQRQPFYSDTKGQINELQIAPPRGSSQCLRRVLRPILLLVAAVRNCQWVRKYFLLIWNSLVILSWFRARSRGR